MIAFSVLGRLLTADLERHWEEWLRLHWFYPQHKLPDCDFAISVQALERAPTLEPDEWVTLELVEWQVRARLEETSVTFGDENSGAQLELTDNAAQIRFWGTAPSLGAMLHALISEALRASGLLSLHASAGTQDGRVTAFLGVSGAGKTTTLLRALRTGWQPICEDLLWLEVGSLQVFGWDRGLRLLPDTLDQFAPALPALQTAGTQTDKWFVPYEGLQLEPNAGTLAQLALLRRSDTHETHWTPSSRREIALGLWQATGLPLTKRSQAFVATVIAGLVDRLEAACLFLGHEDFSPLPSLPFEALSLGTPSLESETTV
jgi:hypothetical protein